MPTCYEYSKFENEPTSGDVRKWLARGGQGQRDKPTARRIQVPVGEVL